MRERSINQRALCEEQKMQLKLSNKKSSAMIILRRSSLSFSFSCSNSVSEGVVSGDIVIPL
jgi:hypothetical protein